jgi:hypothetical protein
MGSISALDELSDLDFLKRQFRSSVFVETGCYKGNSISYSLNLGFDRVISCDIDLESIEYCKNMFSNKKVELYHASSVDFLSLLLPNLSNVKSIMFWLDAHLPDKRINQKIDLPLEEELEIINSIRPNSTDVILIDDLRIYEDGPYTGGPWDRYGYENLNLSFIDKYNYDVAKFYQHEGYLILTRPHLMRIR